MTELNKHKYIQKGLLMNIVTNQISITLSKTQMNTIINETLNDELMSAAVKRAITPALDGAFTQFPEHTIISLGATNEDGSVTCILKQPAPKRQVKSDKGLDSMEPLVESEDAPEEQVETSL